MKTESRQTPSVRSWLVVTLSLSLLAVSCGGGNGEDAAPPPPAPKGVLSMVAGATQGTGYQDGAAADALFAAPPALALTPAGDLMLADSTNQAVRKLTASGTVGTVAGGQPPRPFSFANPPNYADGPGPAARFDNPSAVVVDAAGNTYVADNYTVRKIDSQGVVSTVAGKPRECGFDDGPTQVATLCGVIALRLDGAGNLYILSGGGDRPFRKITPAGMVSTLPLKRTWDLPSTFVVDASGALFIVAGSTIQKYTPQTGLVQVAGSADAQGNTDGDAATARFGTLLDLALDASGKLYALDQYPPAYETTQDHSIAVRRIGEDGTVSTVLHIPHVQTARSLVIDANGNFIVSLGNSLSAWIQKFRLDGTTSVLAGKATPYEPKPVPADGAGAQARFIAPLALASTKAGALYVGDASSITTLRKVEPDGSTSTLPLTWDTVPNEVQSRPSWRAMAVDGNDNLYTASNAWLPNQPSYVYKVTPQGAIRVLADLSPWFPPFEYAGRSYKYGGPVNGLVADPAGNVYAAGVNGTIVKITPQGIVSLLAGSAGVLGHQDGLGSAARFSVLGNMTTDPDGNLYVVDGLHDAFTGIGPTIRKITPSGVVSTVAGRADLPAGYVDGPAASAQFTVAGYSTLLIAATIPWGTDFDGFPSTWGGTASLAADAKGNLYLTDPRYSVIRKIAKDGQVSTVVGQAGRKGFLAGEAPGIIHTPVGIVVRDSKLFFTTHNAVAQVTLPQ
ncbi:hypothetical protein [Acidovorax sp. Root568]|uniref:hypothetical protein n=1 Tax=Acidovorax sp. Root568 TaxID=1736565 RepID=UPI000AE6A20D|nr:hypothetical protein [Acidovorax sp. Root568]